MPLLAFCCDDCGAVFDELLKAADASDQVRCKECGGTVHRHYQGKALFGQIGSKEFACAPAGGCGHAGTGCGCACRR